MFSFSRKQISGVTALVVLLWSWGAAAQVQARQDFDALSTLWVLVAAFLVFFMNAGFALLEVGLVRAKNAVSVLGKNFVVFALATVAFWSVGYGLMFGEGSTFAGGTGFLVSGSEPQVARGIPTAAFFFFQSTFAATACSIVSGAVAERIKYGAFMLFGVLLVAVVYSVAGHWTWSTSGFLAARGFHDFAGSTVVHSVGGWAALAGVMVVGPRLGRYDNKGRPRAIPGHNLPLAVLGGFILWLGWFGFNPGSELAFNEAVPRIAVATNLSAVFGLITATAVSWGLIGKPDLTMSVNGTLAGLVGVTAPCAVVSPLGAAAIGAVAGAIVVVGVLAFDRLKLDDPVGALSVHLLCGIWGTLSVGLFAVPGQVEGVTGLFYGGGVTQLLSQMTGIAVYAVWAFSLSWLLWQALRFIYGIRVDQEEERKGLDQDEMGMVAYADDSLP